MPLGLDRINAFNPWWYDDAWRQRDRHLSAAAAAGNVSNRRSWTTLLVPASTVAKMRLIVR